jgi:serine/threonine protein kinase
MICTKTRELLRRQPSLGRKEAARPGIGNLRTGNKQSMRSGTLVQTRYRLDQPLGRGGMAEVWSCLDERLDRRVAVKFLAPELSDQPESLVRFFTEAQAVARISHPNVISVLDFGQHESRPFLVMEYLEGASLHDRMGEPFLVERAFEIVEDAARAAGAAHSLGLIHRDIKPGNILMDRDGRAKLADFGIASSNVSEQLTSTGVAVGSPHYVSPEQASGHACTPQSDVYSLGVVLYEILTGKVPFDAPNATAIAIAHVEQPPEPPSTHVPDLDQGVDSIVLRCLAKEPADRFDDGAALAAALHSRDARSGHPAPMDDDEEYLAAPSGARRALVAMLTAALLVGLLGLVVWAAFSEPRRDLPGAGTSEQPGQDRSRSATPAAAPSSEQAVFSSDHSPDPAATQSPASSKTRGGDRGTAAGDAGAPAQGGAPAPSPEPSPEPTQEPTPEATPTEAAD